ncbi:MAG: choice-of-anchor E domain-containing protein [Candidatus Cloacimonetes bacterium]|nr:choice-of-anchor E domain-containing protein [Candidatus Cloacimonadota bacterium]
MKKVIILAIALMLFSFSWANFYRWYCCNTGWHDTDWPAGTPKCCNLPAAPIFPENDLIGAILYITVKNNQDVGVENTSVSSPASINVQTTLNFFVNDYHEISNQQIQVQAWYPGPTGGDFQNLAVFDGTIDYAGASGYTWANVENQNTWNHSYTDLSLFTSTFPVCWWTNSGYAIFGEGSTNIDASIDTQAWAQACIWYEYEGDEPSPVELSSFTAIYFDGLPTLNWTTQSEINNLGWNVYRSNSSLYSEASQLNTLLIPGQGTSTTPHDYEYVDQTEVVSNNTYWYWIEDVSMDGETNTHGPIDLFIPESGYDPVPPEILKTARLYNTPNPFNPTTWIMFDIDTDVAGDITIYDIKGNLVRNLHEGYIPETGVMWDSTDDSGKKVPSGIYLYVLKTSGRTFAKKMVLTK